MEEEDAMMDDSDEMQELLHLVEHKKSEPAGEAEYPHVLPIIPVTRRPYCPFMTAPIMIEPGPYYDLLKEIAKMEGKFIGIVLTKKEEQDIYDVGFNDIYDVGVVARILRILNVQESGAQVILSMERRFKIQKQVNRKAKVLFAEVEYHKEQVNPRKKDLITAYSSNLIKTIRELITLNPIFKEELQIFLSHSEFAQPYKLCDFAVALTTASRESLQEILSTFDLVKRMDKALILLKKELDISRLQNSINQKLEANISKTQREYFLREQMKAIQKELGIAKDDKALDAEKFNERVKKIHLSPEAEKVFKDEIDKLQMLDMQSAEYSVVRNYLDWLTILPWGIKDDENTNLAKAAKVLDQDHYGLKDIKERILEFISVGLLKKTGTKGYILCFVGPPGVGKTSVGKSIARALGRKFFRFSVGGMRDESEIRGHRRTYVGAMPGKIIQALKLVGACNPIIMIGEIDKMGASYQGDPAAALLEVLDPEQNQDFLDHYLDLRFDLSNTLFIVTANTLDTISPALRDRMEVLRLSGYIEEEKVQIAKKYLIPKSLKDTGLKRGDVNFNVKAIRFLINGYCREAGVRQLEKNTNKIFRKIAAQKIKYQEKQQEWEKIEIDQKAIIKFLGKPDFHSERFYKENIPGIALGLAWTAFGGSILYIEAVQTESKEKMLKITGNAGEVMKESSQIAFTYMLSKKDEYLPEGASFGNKEIHVHIPEGATPKDGPSAGITLTTAMISLMRQEPVPPNVGMTGEITLKGKILPIGGLKEKILAAKREDITHIIAPHGNIKDYEELAPHIKKGISLHFVEDYVEVFELIFGKGKKKFA